MKRLILGLVVSCLAACEMLGTGPADDGQLRISFVSSPDDMTRASYGIPDTSDFMLMVSDQQGKIIYEGPYGASPEAMMVAPGSYTVSAVSSVFSKPAFSAPQFGDEQCVVVPSGGVANVQLTCRQLNSGVKLEIHPDFLVHCPDCVLTLKSSKGSLMYSYSEKRIAYFHPGNVSLVMSRSGKDEVLLTRNLEAQQIFVLGITASSSMTGDVSSDKKTESVSMVVDTSRIWVSDHYQIGGDKGASVSGALTVSQAQASAGEEDVWVSGYVVGGDLTSSSASFEGPFSSRTCLLLGPRSSTTDRKSCISVQLPSGEVRDALNLLDNPELLGRKIMINGDIVPSYYGLVGLKNCSDYRL